MSRVPLGSRRRAPRGIVIPAALLALACSLVAPAGVGAQDVGMPEDPFEETAPLEPSRPSASSPRTSASEESRAELRRQLDASGSASILPGAVDPETYRVGPGDVFLLSIWGGFTRNVPIEVSPEGSVLLPNAGTLRVDGLTLRQARNEMLAKLRPEFRGVQMDLRLQRTRQFSVYVTGAVRAPGPMTAHGTSRVSDVVLRAEPLGGSALRNISILHRDGSRDVADLELFLRSGDQSLNPWLRDGDVLHVQPAGSFVHVQGAIARPGRFELGPRDSLRTLLTLGGGLIPSADTTNALFVRWVTPTRSESILVDVGQVLSGRFNPTLRNGDRLYVYFIPQYQVRHEATVFGHVLRPGIYPIQVGRDRISDLIRATGGFLPGADLAAIRVRRASQGDAQDPELQRLLRLSRAELTNSEYDVLQTKLAGLREEYRIDWSRLTADPALDVLLLGGDIVQVDRLVSSIRVDGQVRRPGVLSYTPGRSLMDYVELAGGYSERAWKSKIRVTRSVTGQTFYAKDISQLDPGDLIWVPEKPDVTFWDQTRTILTAAAEIATVILAFNAVNN
jgi:polysaccharide biosynthesis/export protein